MEPELKTIEFNKLIKSLLLMENEIEIAAFLRDVMTIDEIKEISNRFDVAQRLYKGEKVRAITKETGMSSTTVSRINFWLHHGKGGYLLALRRLKG